MIRNDGRSFDQLRPLIIERNFIKHAEGSCLVCMGNTKVVCTASVEKKVPLFLKNTGKGWVTSEYGMLPRSTNVRMFREREKLSGRNMEIQRLVGRVLRSVADIGAIGERSIVIDCDVVQADGGTRVASIIGGFTALVDCMNFLHKRGDIKNLCIFDYVGAVSVGMLKGAVLLDLNYDEDSGADVDLNVVIRGNGEIVELQGTAEHSTFSRDELNVMLDLAQKGISEIIAVQKKIFKDILANI